MASPSRPSLKGIISTNDDPDRCAVCFQEFPKSLLRYQGRTTMLYFCCGKQVCEQCRTNADLSGGHCPVCKRPAAARDSIGTIKKNAKNGRPWAQYCLGISFTSGRDVVQSDFEALRWLRKADKRGHPAAALVLGAHYLDGRVCEFDLVEARRYAERAIALDENVASRSHSFLYDIAVKYNDIQTEKAKKEQLSIVTFLANEGMKEAQYYLGVVLFQKDGDVNNGEKLTVLAALQGHVGAAYYAALFSISMRKHSQAMLWSTIVSKASPDSMDSRYRSSWMEDIAGIQYDLRRLRDECGGCGAALDGKMRKYCKQCKTYCYCGRECQKLHWNRLEGGHRHECMETLSLKEKMADIRFGSGGDGDGK